MADLLLRWINHELQLSKHVTDVQVDFASGYLLGELLHRLNQQHNFDDFVRSSTADAKIINFCLLEPSLRNLNIQFDANVATAIMNEKKDTAANLLNQIKIAATRLGRAPSVSTRSLERKSIFPLHNRPVKLAKPIYDSENHRLFEHSIRRHVQSVSAIEQDKGRVVEEKDKRQAYLDKVASQKQLLEATKAERLHRAFIYSSFIKEALDETDSPAWRLALQKKNAREQRRAAFFQQLMKKREEAEEHLSFSLRQQVQRDLDDFDSRSGSVPGIAGGKFPFRKSVGYGLRSLTTTLGSASDKTKYSTSNLAGSASNEWELHQANMMEMESTMGTIKQQRNQREMRKGNLSRRRKRFIQECVYSHSRIETARVASILEDVVLRDTNSEKDIQGEMSRILTYKEVARENRSMRDQEYVNQQELDTLTAVNRDTSCYHNLILRFEDDNEIQTIQRRNVQVSVESADHHLSKQISGVIMNDLVEFVLFIAGKREDTMHSRDPTVFLASQTWSEYKIQFASSHMISSMSSLPISTDPSFGEFLNSHVLEQYLASFPLSHTIPVSQPASRIVSEGVLFLGTMDVIKDCYVLGEEIKALRWIARASGTVQQESVGGLQMPASSQPAAGPRRHLRILIFGPPFVGKKTQAKLLGEKHNLVVRSVHELIQDAILKSSDVGRQMEALLSNGTELPPEFYSRLVVDSIDDIEAQSLRPENSNMAGWIIYDLPATEQHNQNLEEKLTGYVDPTLIPSSYDFESPIAPGYSKPALPPTFLHGKSGVDLVFHLDCPMNTVLDRCLGSVEDSSTRETHHLVFNPPPDDSTARHRLHHVNPSAGISELLSLHCLANDNFSRDHKAWHAKFRTLYEQPSSELTISEVQEAMDTIVSAFQKEVQNEAASKQYQQEENEQRLMTSEQERHRHIFAFEAAIDEAKLDVTKIEESIAEAEEAKAKKEEMLELRHTLEEAHRRLEGVVDSAKSWQEEELSLRPTTASKYSGDLVPSTAGALVAIWDDMEAEYITSMKTSFELLRKQRHQVTDHAQIVTRDFCEFVRRPDQKQNIVDQFQRRFNEVIEEMRFDDLTKVELHARVDILQDELTDLVAAKVSENEEELSGMIGDGWMEDTCQQVAAIYQIALQAECDRFRVSIQLLVDGYYSASTDHSQLSSVMESWQAHQPRLDLVCKIYRDPTNEIPQETPPAPAATGKAAPKGKAKPSTPAVVPPASVATNEETLAELLTINELLAEYSRVLQRCDSLVEAIAPIAAAAGGNGAGGSEFQQTEDSLSTDSIGDLCKMNLLNGIRYEHNLMQRRVRFLQVAAEKSCDEITRSMRSIELTLRDVLEDRKNREQVAVAALVEYVHSAVEAEVALPSYIDVSPESTERFPATVQLREDTLVRVNTGRRLLPRTPPDAPPIIEESHPLLLSEQQRDDLRDVLLSQSTDNSGLLPLCLLIETIAAFTSQPDALPDVWRRCPAHIIAEIAASFTTKQGAFVDVEALLDAMSTREDLLQRFQEEAKEQLERQRQLERQCQQEELERELQQQEQQETHEAEPTNVQ